MAATPRSTVLVIGQMSAPTRTALQAVFVAGVAIQNVADAQELASLAQKHPDVIVVGSQVGAGVQELLRRLRSDPSTAAIPILSMLSDPAPELSSPATSEQATDLPPVVPTAGSHWAADLATLLREVPASTARVLQARADQGESAA